MIIEILFGILLVIIYTGIFFYVMKIRIKKSKEKLLKKYNPEQDPSRRLDAEKL